VKFKVVNNPSQAFVFPTITNGQVYTPLFNSTFYEENYLGAAHDYQDVILNNEGTYTYCMENANMSELQGNSTMVYIKAVFEPTELWDAAGDPMQPTESTFWRIRNENTGIWETGYYGEEPTTSEIGKEVIKFEDGICYYHAWLKNEASGLYMVKRNTYVKLTITAVYGSGEPGEGGGIDPEKPIEETTDAYIKVRVLDWEDDEQSTTL